jgi:cytochrome c5
VPNTIMPPYGKNRILSDDEIDALVIYLETI